MLDRPHPALAAPRGAALPGPGVTLASLVTATPAHRVPQALAKERAREVFASRMPFFPQLEQVFDNAAIDYRYSCLPVEWFLRPADFGEKSRLYVEHATALAEMAAERALTAASLAPSDIDAIVFVSSTGISTPSIEARLMNRMPFRADTMRLPIFGLGCAGGVLGLTRAAQFARSLPDLNVLLIVVELSSLAFRYDRITKSNMVACALFGDGAAGAVLTSGGAGEAGAITIGDGGEHLWPGTLGVMGWDIDAQGLDVIFQQSIPDIVARDFGPALDGFLEKRGLDRSAFNRTCCHPGGTKVVIELERVLGMAEGGLDAERRVLRGHGNMSAPTVLFVLDELIRSGESGRLLLTSLGPGFTSAFQFVDVAASPRAS